RLCSACRTLLCKSKRGGLKDTYPDEIHAPEVIEKTNLNPAGVGDIVVRYVLGSGSQRARECRMTAFYAVFPGLTTTNRQCSSVLQAVVDVAASIKPGSSNGGLHQKMFHSALA
ncbi:3-ketoacyl-CoA thiolase 2, peroxisomal, partial [Tanacetum coccineum]